MSASPWPRLQATSKGVLTYPAGEISPSEAQTSGADLHMRQPTRADQFIDRAARNMKQPRRLVSG